MVDTLMQLITLLSQKRDLMEKVLPLLEEENRCIVELDLAGLSAAVEQKAEFLEELQLSSERCKALMYQLAGELGLPEAQGLTPLLPRLQAPHQEELKGLQGALLESGATFERSMSRNGELLKGALQTVTQSLDFIGGLFRRSNTYGAAGQMVGGSACTPRIFCKDV